MLIDQKYYTIVRNDVPVLTKQANGSYINTNNYFINVRLIGETIKQIVKPFGFGDDILTAVDKSYGKFNVFEFAALTTPNITTPDFNTDEDTLAIGLYHITGPKSYVWVCYFETNPEYRYCANNAKYKRVGTSACCAFQELHKDRGIAGRMPLGVHPFYLKNGFKHMDERECFLGWNLQR